jgi:hypothetical protein
MVVRKYRGDEDDAKEEKLGLINLKLGIGCLGFHCYLDAN